MHSFVRSEEAWRTLRDGWYLYSASYSFYLLTFLIVGFVAMKLCPELILLPLNFDKYSKKSSEIISIFKQYDPNMLVAGCDEGYMKCVSIYSM